MFVLDLFIIMFSFCCIVTRRPISRQCLKYAHATLEKVLGEVFSMWSVPCTLLGNGPIDMHSDNRRGVFFAGRTMLSADNEPINTQSDTWYMFSAWSMQSLYNENLFVARSVLKNWDWEFGRRIRSQPVKTLCVVRRFSHSETVLIR
jgi:hypothetical protein